MSHLVLFACPGMPDRATVAQYEKALAPLGSVHLVWIALPGTSGVFTRLGQDCRDHAGRVLPRLLKRYAAGLTYHTVSLISYSAGFGLARELLRDESDREALDAYVALDSVHGPRAATERASEPFLAYARRAAAGRCLFWLGHTDVPVGPYMSTTEMAGFLAERVQPDCNWVVRAYDTAPPDRARREHGNALVLWGASFAVEALVPYLASISAASSLSGLGAHQGLTISLGERLIAWYLDEQADGVAEHPPGSNTGPRIREYHSVAERGGRRLGLTSGPWCASMCSFGLLELGAPDWLVPRCSGYELEQDARAAGVWRDRPEAVGDVCILGRGGQAWQRHVCVVVDMPDEVGQFSTIGGNENNRICITDRDISDAAVRGFICLPQPSAVAEVRRAVTDSAETVARAIAEVSRFYG